jgi:cation transport regulator ChaB
MPSRVRNQLAFDEQMVEDTALENALEDRQRRRDSLSAVRTAYDEANEVANARIAEQELPDGHAIRVGRFRITRSSVPARNVAFEAKATSRVRILLIDGDEE